MTESQLWGIWALRAGRSRMDRSVATYLDGMGDDLLIPHTMFLLRGPKNVIVDTSFQSVEAVKSAYPQEIWRDPDEEPAALLAACNISPADVELVICTHLHYDHCGSNRLFVSAEVVVQRRELDYALHPRAAMMAREFFSPAAGFTPPYEVDQLRIIDGEADLAPGLRVIPLPGHTPGLQGVVVTTARGRAGILGDHVMLRANWDQTIPVGLHTSVDDWYTSTDRVRPLVDYVLPSHDMELFGTASLIARVA